MGRRKEPRTPEEAEFAKDYQEYESFQRVLEFDIRAARDLLYGEQVVEALKKATTVPELTRIMSTARRNSKK